MLVLDSRRRLLVSGLPLQIVAAQPRVSQHRHASVSRARGCHHRTASNGAS